MNPQKILVFGSYVTDLNARTPRFPAEGETIVGSMFKSGPGGKGSNQAVAAKRAGGNVSFISRLGDDVFGSVALDFYKGEGIDTSAIIIDKDSYTGAAMITVNDVTSQNEIVVVLGACSKFTSDEIQRIDPEIEASDIVLCQLETNLEATLEVLTKAHAKGKLTILNPAPACALPDSIFSSLDYITPNETEAELLTGIAVTDRESASKAADVFLSKGAKNVIITLGKNGYYAKNACEEIAGKPIEVNVIDTTGAGDAFNGGFAAALAENMNLKDALGFANTVGGLSVEKIGTAPAMPYRDKIDWKLRCLRMSGQNDEHEAKRY